MGWSSPVTLSLLQAVTLSLLQAVALNGLAENAGGCRKRSTRQRQHLVTKELLKSEDDPLDPNPPEAQDDARPDVTGTSPAKTEPPRVSPLPELGDQVGANRAAGSHT